MWFPVLVVLAAVACSEDEKPPQPPPPEESTLVNRSFTNPLKISIPATGGLVENCPDPTVIRGQQEGDTSWYLYCTSDPLNDQDKDSSGNYKQHFIPTFKSSDMVEWTYVGDALSELPVYALPDSDIWAPEVVFFKGKYFLYYTVVRTLESTQDDDVEAIGVATSNSPVGPWTQELRPAVEPHEAPCCGLSRRSVIDPEVVITDSGDRYIYYGSYYGGVSVRALSANGLISDPYSQVEVTVANRYEAPNVIKHGDYYYLLASSANCCNGPLTGYSVFAGRSQVPWGPFLDREGVPLTTNRVGGTPVLGMNGNRWVGTGHNTVVTDSGGQDWIIYHAVDRTDPYLAPDSHGGLPLKRQALMDALDWVEEWPVVRGGQGPSDSEQPAPAARAGTRSRYTPVLEKPHEPGNLIASASDEFDGSALGSPWTWTRPPDPTTYGVENGTFHFDTQDADLYQDNNSASVLWRPAPSGDYLVETKFSLNLPPTSCCHNYVQAGLIIQSDDNHYVRLVHFSNWETRQVAFAKEVGPDVPPGYPRYGETLGGPTAETMWLRIARTPQGEEELYTAYSSRDGVLWSRAGTWTHQFGSEAKIGLISLGGRGFTATFDYFHVYELKN
ncbi:family 43 glycosylhydrolase [Hyalangium versicolor]|uniref:family 43 glycosylhydrolase n=1 Tax=Hyalangium versicolor TaxID=2861190 RepID=UPI001CC9B26B|nr:family 43 glycosylhydrolase [Hyalangium versicolor]